MPPPGRAGTMPVARAAAAPPLEPPAVLAGSQGFTVGGPSRFSVVGRPPNSGVLVLPTSTAPFALRRAQ